MADVSIFTSSKSNEWETPQDLFDKLNAVYHFTLDPASTEENHKCDKYYTKENDGLSKDWRGEVVFCNPPYGKEIGAWVKKVLRRIKARCENRVACSVTNRHALVS